LTPTFRGKRQLSYQEFTELRPREYGICSAVGFSSQTTLKMEVESS